MSGDDGHWFKDGDYVRERFRAGLPPPPVTDADKKAGTVILNAADEIECQQLIAEIEGQDAAGPLAQKFRERVLPAFDEKVKLQQVRDVANEVMKILDGAPKEKARVILAAAERLAKKNEKRLKLEDTILSEKGALLAEEIRDLKLAKRIIGCMNERPVAMALAVDLWERTYKLGLSEKRILDITFEETVSFAEARRESITMTDIEQDPDLSFLRYAVHLTFLARWAHYTFPMIQTSHTYAAALMCTDLYPELLDDLRVQWGAFRLIIPHRMLPAFGELDPDDPETAAKLDAAGATRDNVEDLFVSHVDVLVMEDGKCAIAGYAAIGFRVFYIEGDTLAAALLQDPGDDKEDMQARVTRVCQRLLGGLLLAMVGSKENYREKEVKAKKAPLGSKRREREEPGHRLVTVGEPVKVDARPAVKAYLSGVKNIDEARRRAGISAFQWLVRGHYRRQVHGVGRKQRKVIWIQPFWRGNADMPIMSKPKDVRGT